MSLPATTHDEAVATVEIAGEVRRTLSGYMDWTVRQWRLLLADLDKKHAGYVAPGERDDLALLREHARFAIDAFERMGSGDPVRLDHLTPDEYSWYDITDAIARDEDAGRWLATAQRHGMATDRRHGPSLDIASALANEARQGGLAGRHTG